MKKKLLLSLLLSLFIFTLTSCGGKGADLLILNWGDYIAEEVILAFEEEYDVTVKVTTTDSSEQMYNSLINRTAEFDIVVPSDYMIDQMAHEDLIYKLDYSKLSNYSADVFVPELQSIMSSENTQTFNGYYIPYFWGSLGIMYNKKRPGVEEAVLEYSSNAFFSSSISQEIFLKYSPSVTVDTVLPTYILWHF